MWPPGSIQKDNARLQLIGALDRFKLDLRERGAGPSIQNSVYVSEYDHARFGSALNRHLPDMLHQRCVLESNIARVEFGFSFVNVQACCCAPLGLWSLDQVFILDAPCGVFTTMTFWEAEKWSSR